MEILKLREHSELASEAATWFHSKWDIPAEEYAESIQECLAGKSIVPQWYVVVERWVCYDIISFGITFRFVLCFLLIRSARKKATGQS